VCAASGGIVELQFPLRREDDVISGGREAVVSKNISNSLVDNAAVRDPGDTIPDAHRRCYFFDWH